MKVEGSGGYQALPLAKVMSLSEALNTQWGNRTVGDMTPFHLYVMGVPDNAVEAVSVVKAALDKSAALYMFRSCASILKKGE